MNGYRGRRLKGDDSTKTAPGTLMLSTVTLSDLMGMQVVPVPRIETLDP